MINILGWVGNVGYIIGIILLGRKRIEGFYFNLVANILYFSLGRILNLSSIWVLSLILGTLNIIAIINWKRSKSESSC